MTLDSSDIERQNAASDRDPEMGTGSEEIEQEQVPSTSGGEAMAEDHEDRINGSSTREELEYQIADLEGQVEQLRDQLLRRQAELVNFRKRVERERAELSTVAQAGVVERLLPVIDDFERALVVDADDVEAYRAGVELIFRSVENLLSNMRVERLEPLHEEFDPEVHEAIARVETTDAPEGSVVEVYLPAYEIAC
jgi:molecular chaperone GrpE